MATLMVQKFQLLWLQMCLRLKIAGDSSSSGGTLEAASSDSEMVFSGNDESEECMDEGTPSFSEDSEESYCSDDSEETEKNLAGVGLRWLQTTLYTMVHR